MSDEPRKGLVLTRQVGQEVYIENGLVIVQVVSVRGKQVKLKFIGNVQIDRREVVESKIAKGEI